MNILNDLEVKKRWLLDAIKHIKHQKQRPDRERICNFVQQHNHVTAEEVSLLLDHCVSAGIMTTAITRGNTDKLTYIITDPDTGKPTCTMKSPYRSGGESEQEPLLSADDKRLLHNKSDISHLMVQAVKGLYCHLCETQFCWENSQLFHLVWLVVCEYYMRKLLQ